jgi:O-antigen/teichoic acid export membrane protein
LRFDIAIALPEKDEDALTLMVLAIGISAFVSLTLLMIVLLTPSAIADLLQQPVLSGYLWLIPITILLFSGSSALQMWCIRQKQFNLISSSRIGQSAGSSGLQIIAGLLKFGPGGLLFGQTINAAVACVIFGHSLLRDSTRRLIIRNTSWQSIRTLYKTYDHFPKYSTWEALCNTASIQLPILVIAAKAVPEEAGYLMMATYVMQAPTALIGAAVGQVYLSNAAIKHRSGELRAFTLEVLYGLMKTGIAPLVLIGVLAPFLFGWIFGESWDRAGILVLWMTPWFIMQFLCAPISMCLHVSGHQKAALLLQVFGVVFRLGIVGAACFAAPMIASESYAVTGFVFYAVYLATVLQMLKR